MVHFIVTRRRKNSKGEDMAEIEDVGTFTSLMFWKVLIPLYPGEGPEQYMTSSAKTLRVLRYDCRKRTLFSNSVFIASDISLEEAQELVLSDPAIKEEGIHPHYIYTARDIVSEVFLA